MNKLLFDICEEAYDLTLMTIGERTQPDNIELLDLVISILKRLKYKDQNYIQKFTNRRSVMNSQL